MLAHPDSILGLLQTLAIATTIPALILTVRHRTRQKSPRPDETIDGTEANGNLSNSLPDCEEEEIVGTLDDLLQAERDLSLTNEERKSKLDPCYTLHARYSTEHGYRDFHLAEIMSKFAESGIRAKLITEEILSPRAGRNLSFMGHFDVYIHRDDLECAAELERAAELDQNSN